MQSAHALRLLWCGCAARTRTGTLYADDSAPLRCCAVHKLLLHLPLSRPPCAESAAGPPQTQAPATRAAECVHGVLRIAARAQEEASDEAFRVHAAELVLRPAAAL